MMVISISTQNRFRTRKGYINYSIDDGNINFTTLNIRCYLDDFVEHMKTQTIMNILWI